MSDLPEGLLDDVKDYLNITWQDDKTDKKVTGYINRGIKRLQEIAGASLDFVQEDSPRSLLMDYCRYANSQALEVFETNFRSELLELNFLHQIGDFLLTVISLPGTNSGQTALTVSPALSSGNSYMYLTAETVVLPDRGDICNIAAGYLPWDGTGQITATTGNEITVVEVNSAGAAQRAGRTAVAAKG